jgi:acetyl/propionyl-CoA carboxylase alpha subunit/acetyl-CoA carboxylase carboxyltransferase component
MQNEFQRVAIVNRGEAAMRFIHAAREFREERGTPLQTIALFTEPDQTAMFVREADEAFFLGAAHFSDSDTHRTKSTYLDYGRLRHALAATRADAVWVGWGFVAEHAAFADLCQELGIVFIGPSGEVMRKLGDKIAAKRLAERCQIPVAPWSGGAVDTLADALAQAEGLLFPILIKAAAGGGGRGIRRVSSLSQLPQLFESARAEAYKAFGDPTVFLEQLVPSARHVEVQIIADLHGTTWAVGVRDCTIQRRQQKVLEEAPSPVLSTDEDDALCHAAVRLTKAVGYTNAGTVEFLFDPQSRRFWFMEVNTRLQVEHPVTECTTGLDLVKLQMHVASGGRLLGTPPPLSGHAIEVRLNAEDPDNGFAAAPGTIERFRIATGPGIRLDTGVAEGESIPPEFDSMIGKLIAHGQNRHEALARLKRALRQSVIVIKGGASNKAFLLDLLNREELETSHVDIGWLDRVASSGVNPSAGDATVAMVQAAIDAYDAELEIAQAQFHASAARGRPHVGSEIGRTFALRYRGQIYSLTAYRLGPSDYRIETDGVRIACRIDRMDQYQCWLRAFGRRFHIVSILGGVKSRIEVDGVAYQVDRDDGGIVHAPAPAVVVSIAVKPGDPVMAGDRLAVLEAMKMETQVVAPFAGTVRLVMTMPNVQVDTGDPLVQIDVVEAENPLASEQRVNFRTPHSLHETSDVSLSCKQSLNELRQLMLGFDLEPAQAMRQLAAWSETCPAGSEEIRKRENEILSIFVDICSLFNRGPDANHGSLAEDPSAESCLFSYLRAVETRGEGLPPSFSAALRRALAHYDIHSLESSPRLKESLLWICKSHQRMEQQLPAILDMLHRRMRCVKREPPSDGPFRDLLDRMISIAHESYPQVSDLAREVRYRFFDEPLFERTRRQVYAEVEEHLARLAKHPDAAERCARIQALVECPQLLAGFLAGWFPSADAVLRQTMLEVLTRRYYKIRTLLEPKSSAIDGCCYFSAEYDHEGRRIHVVAASAEFSALCATAEALFPLLAEIPPDHDIVLDFYLYRSVKLDEPEATQREVQSRLNQVAFPRPLRRIVVAVAGVSHGARLHRSQHFTYRLGADGYAEDAFYRGLHPMMGKRLHLWRLSNFRIERLPSIEDVYLLLAVARDNPKDQRLFAAAEVRDVTPVRDEAGRIAQLPYLERMFMEALAAIRSFQYGRRPQERLHWNRVFLYVWPPLALQSDELHTIIRKLAPTTEGLGLEQVVVRARIPNPATGELRDMVVRISSPVGSGLLVTFRPAEKLLPLKPLNSYDQKVIRVRQRGLVYPYEIVKMLTPGAEDPRAEFPPGDFVEHDFDPQGRLVPVDRPYGQNKANIIVGVIRNFTSRYPEGMRRVLLLGDPSKDLGALAETECRLIIAAIDLAEEMGAPVEWFPISAGAKISMDSGVENMDWIARVLRRLVTFTQAGGEVNLLINGINVGAQPYWNAEATMLMHTRGILVMTPKAAMVLTGKRALDYSGGVSAEDNQGIGGYDRIMGVNGQAQYWARDINEACHILFRHYEHTYVLPGERFPRRAPTIDPSDRDVRNYRHSENGEEGFARIGEILSDETNPGRKKPFDIRRVMMAAIDQDHLPLERWAGMRAAETAVVWDAHLGGYPVCLIGIESRSVQRMGFVPADGPDQWSAGTLFPQSSKKVARAINAASGNRPVVVLANLSGFDGSPESMRRLQLEYGAEIGRAVVNFRGPIVFCVISRYHGGAYVVFSRTLNEQLEVAALEGSYASVIGGAPAAAVVFASEVEARARKDQRLQALNEELVKAEGSEKARLRAWRDEVFKVVHSEKLGEMAAEFDRVHSVHRARGVGALHHIIPPARLRPYLIDAVERGRNAESARGTGIEMTQAA